MTGDAELLFDEFAARHARGEGPDAREYLERAGESRDELAKLLDGFLAGAPVQSPSQETRALFGSLVPELAAGEVHTPPLLAERVRRGWRREEVVTWIRERFAIGDEKEEKVARYWHEVETGLHPLSGVSERLREALSERFGEAAKAALGWVPPALEPKAEFRRVADAPAAAPPGMLLHERLSAGPKPARDEVDELFGYHP